MHFSWHVHFNFKASFISRFNNFDFIVFLTVIKIALNAGVSITESHSLLRSDNKQMDIKFSSVLIKILLIFYKVRGSHGDGYYTAA